MLRFFVVMTFFTNVAYPFGEQELVEFANRGADYVCSRIIEKWVQKDGWQAAQLEKLLVEQFMNDCEQAIAGKGIPRVLYVVNKMRNPPGQMRQAEGIWVKKDEKKAD
jgi:dipeptidase